MPGDNYIVLQRQLQLLFGLHLKISDKVQPLAVQMCKRLYALDFSSCGISIFSYDGFPQPESRIR